MARLLCALTMGCLCAPDVLMQRNDERRLGINSVETKLTQQSVRNRFGRLGTLYSDSQIMAQPLNLANLKSKQCPAGCQTVIFGTMNNTVYAYRVTAGPVWQIILLPPISPRCRITRQNNDVLLWAKWLGNPRPSDQFHCVIGQLVAFNAENIRQPTLFQSGGAGAPDTLGLLARFCPPTRSGRFSPRL